jgi:hypothetical protein
MSKRILPVTGVLALFALALMGCGPKPDPESPDAPDTETPAEPAGPSLPEAPSLGPPASRVTPAASESPKN